MPLIEWDPRFSVGHPKVDEQHKMLVDAINQLAGAVSAGKRLVELEPSLIFMKGQAEIHLLTDTGVFRTLEQLASADPLTGAWNRRHFDEAVEGEIHRSRRYGHPVSLILLDLDHFKRINDTFGHPVGDQVLQEAARRVRSATRLSDSLTRWGGEEFIVLMPNTGLSSAVVLAARIREQFTAHVFEGVGPVTASLGVAEYVPSASRDEWIDRADRAMYRAKDLGRNRVEADLVRSGTQPATEHLEGAFVKLVWSDAYRCGHALIDAQHEQLFQLANGLLDALLSGRPTDEVSDTIADFLAAVVQHFQDEEEVLEKVGFPGRVAHANLHNAMVTRALELESAFKAGTLSIGSFFQFLACDVVANHMLKADREFFHLTGASGAH